MTDVRFYHLTRRSIQQALPDLLEKTLQKGWRAVVRVADEGEVEPLAKLLWTEKAESFLPHGSAKDGRAADQPIWITAKEERPNDAGVLFLIGGAEQESMNDFDLVCEVFDGAEEQQVDAARAKWKALQKTDHNLTYWQQTESGWEKQG